MEYEQQVMDGLQRSAVEVFDHMMTKYLDFSEVEIGDAPKKVLISQIEVCWNQSRPLDVFHYMTDKLEYFDEIGLKHIDFHSDTPLMVVDYPSDIYPELTRFAHKIYMKTKLNLRNELILGQELKTTVPFIEGTLSDLFFIDSYLAKRFVYSKFILQFLRRTEGLEEEKYRHAYLNFVHMKRGDSSWKKKYLQGMLDRSGIPKEFVNIEFFDVFSDLIDVYGSVHRKNFSQLSYMQFRRLVSESGDFRRMGHGKYRIKEKSVLFNANLEYRAVRARLDEMYPEESALNKIYHSDAGLSGSSKNFQTS
jgi:hypothetical protein